MLLDRKQKEEGWLLLNLGATHDVWVQARAIGVSMAAIGARSKRYAMAADAAERFATRTARRHQHHRRQCRIAASDLGGDVVGLCRRPADLRNERCLSVFLSLVL
jgi:hypothetical protein